MGTRTWVSIAIVGAFAIYLAWLLLPDPPAVTDGRGPSGDGTEPASPVTTAPVATPPVETDRFKEEPPPPATREAKVEPARLRIEVRDDRGRLKPNVHVIVFDETEVFAKKETHTPGIIEIPATPGAPRVLLYDDDLMECETLTSGLGTHEVVLASPHELKGRVLIDGRAVDRVMVIRKTTHARAAAAKILPPVGEHVLKVVPEKKVIMVVSANPSTFDYGQVSPYWQGALEFPKGFQISGATNPRDWSKGPEVALDCPRGYLTIDLTRMPVISGRILLPESHRNLTWIRVRCVANVKRARQRSMHMWDAGVDVETRRFRATLGDTAVTRVSLEVYDSSNRLVGTSDPIPGPFDADRNLGDVVIRK